MAVNKQQKPARKSQYDIAKLLFIGLIFHLVYIGSVFDCYFKSPVVHGMKSYGYKSTGAPAKRLVLIVGDGLRADLLFSLNAFPGIPGSPKIVAPYLRSVSESRGAFGISHTRVPTESRPGHVAIIGGMYEDVSAVTKGWKTNPVDFDSVFNQSHSTYSFGSPDILPMFAKGATPGKVKAWSYDADQEDFTKDATALDIWVLDQMKTLFHNASTDHLLEKELRSDKVVFFLHLLGLDTTGHSYRPHSKEYMENIQVVDDIVKETEKLMSDFYQDEETSFIFTADHGMSVIGNHGDGHPDNTRTPLIAWGSGIRGPIPDTTPTSHDAYSAPWQLGHLFRRDVEQADIAAIMASLIGINWPVNSVGVLPDVDPNQPGYFKTSQGDDNIAHAAFVNAKVILEQYRVKHELKQQSSLFYQPFQPLADVSANMDDIPQASAIAHLLRSNQWNAARQASESLIQRSLQGLHYLQTYDRFMIRAFVTAAYLGWAAFSSLYIVRPLDRVSSVRTGSTATRIISLMSYAIVAAFWASFFLQNSPLTFYIYILFPCYFWREFLVQTASSVDWRSISVSAYRKYTRTIFASVMVVGALLGMVIGYTHRSIWSIGFVVIGVLWPMTLSKDIRAKHSVTITLWAICCLFTAIFPLLSVDKNEDLLTIVGGGIVMLLAGTFASLLVFANTMDEPNRRTLGILSIVQLLLIVATIAITISSVKNLQAKQGLPSLNQWAGWVVLGVSSVLPFLFRAKVHTQYSKILMYALGFGPCFVILSISVEGLFFVAYSLTLITWIQVEQITRSGHSAASRRDTGENPIIGQTAAYKFQSDDLRVALFFLFFVQVGFFGTGNVASISSFYLAPVYRLIPIFNPFYMTTLLLFKIIAPYIMLSVSFAVLNDSLNLPPFSLLLVALSITDGMTLAFFFRVQDTGSWLEIGQSISFFCITSLLLLWSAGICTAGEYLMTDAKPRISEPMRQKLE